MLKDLPVYRSRQVKTQLSRFQLSISGEVSNPTRFLLTDLRKLPTTKLTQDFNCLEGWSVKDVEWEGTRVSEVLNMTKLKPNAKSVLFGSQRYTWALKLAKALEKNTILAQKKFGRVLDQSSGGPVRLVFRNEHCFESVKSVDRIIVLPQLIEGSARNIALKRLDVETILE